MFKNISTLKNFLRVISCIVFSSIPLFASDSNFKSNIFTFDDDKEAKGLQVSLKGDTWTAQNIQWKDLEFHQSIFSDPNVMKNFADGQVRTLESVQNRFKDSIERRFAQGHPHGLLTVKDNETSYPLMHAVAGGGDRPGTSEIAYAMPEENQGKKLGTKVVTSLVKEWAPEVRRIGLGNDLDLVKDAKIIQSFNCFGNVALNQLDATASPVNIASWKILERTGFRAAQCKTEYLADFETTNVETYFDLNAKLMTLFDSNTSPNLPVGKRFSFTDHEGKLRTFSKHTQYEKLKFHFELALD